MEKKLLAFNIIQQKQFGFREKFFTDFKLFDIIKTIHNSLEQDIERALETVWHCEL